MAVVIKPGWSKPSTILFASEYPANEKAFGFALAQAVELGSNLLIFNAYDRVEVAAQDGVERRHGDFALDRAGKRRLEPLMQRAKNLGVECRNIVRHGPPAEEILAFLREQRVDRVVLGARSPGPVGKLLVGSVAETVLRSANMPVCIVSANVVEGSYRSNLGRKILCDLSKKETRQVVAGFAAEMACKHKATLILHQIISPLERAETLAGRTLEQIEAELPCLIPDKLLHKICVRTRVAFGDPTEELLYQARAQQANYIVMGAQGASRFAAVTRAESIYKVLAYAHCPVVTLSPVLLAECGVNENKDCSVEINYLAGVI